MGEFLDELASFPQGPHDDQVDALSGAYSYLATNDEVPCVSPVDIWRENPWQVGSDWRGWVS